MILLFSPYGDRAALEGRFAFAVACHAFVAGQALVYTRPAFSARLAAGRQGLLEAAERLADIVVQTYTLAAEVKTRLEAFRQPAFAVADIRDQLRHLALADFLETVPGERWRHYPRYLRAILVRLDKLPNNLNRDGPAVAELQQRWREYEQRVARLADRDIEAPALADYRWLLEEYRVSLFAQTLKTAVPVSAARLDRLWAEIPK